MTTIFLMALKTLIKDKLNPIKSALKEQIESNKSIRVPFFGAVPNPVKLYNSDLSTEQHDLVDTLSETIIKYDSTGNDAKDAAAIVQLITTCLEEVQAARRANKEPVDKGATVECLSKLLLQVSQFQKKVEKFQFPLINRTYIETPDNVVYHQAAYYLGEEIFAPKEHLDNSIREKKEAKLVERLHELSQLIPNCDTLEKKKTCTLKKMEDLASDNDRLVQGDKASRAYIPSVTVLYVVDVSAPLAMFGAGAGRLGEVLNIAIKKISKMTVDNTRILEPVAPAVSHTDDEQNNPPPPPAEEDNSNVASTELNGEAESHAEAPVASMS